MFPLAESTVMVKHTQTIVGKSQPIFECVRPFCGVWRLSNFIINVPGKSRL